MSLDDYLDRAQRQTLPLMEASWMAVMIGGKPDVKLCLEIGAAIMFEKPILVIVPKGRTIPLSLRTIAHKIVDDVDLQNPDSKRRIQAAIEELMETWKFRKG
jgi:hypothetical protein